MTSKLPEKDYREDFEFNKRLIELIKPHVWLYDNFPKYSVQVSETWEKIAAEMGDSLTVRYLKLHWRWLRDKYVRFYKTGAPDDPNKIASHMHFLQPYILKRQTAVTYSTKMPKVARVESYGQEAQASGDDCSKPNNHLGYDPGDQDAIFLLSILPQMKVMNGQQRREFKIRAVTLSADILGGS